MTVNRANRALAYNRTLAYHAIDCELERYPDGLQAPADSFIERIQLDARHLDDRGTDKIAAVRGVAALCVAFMEQHGAFGK